jgi:predicted kinase
MIVMINGSFGSGKTTIAKRLRSSLPNSVIYDPEWIGYALMRLPSWIRLRGAGSDDFQDIALWRRSTVAGIKLFNLFASGPVIVPMTFSHRAYFDEVIAGARHLDPEIRIFCLKASLSTIRKRMAERGTNIEGGWITRRIMECAEAHHDLHFGEPVDTEERSAREVAEDIVKRLRQPIASMT